MSKYFRGMDFEQVKYERAEMDKINKKLQDILDEAADYALNKSGGSNKIAREYMEYVHGIRGQGNYGQRSQLIDLTIQHLKKRALDV